MPYCCSSTKYLILSRRKIQNTTCSEPEISTTTTSIVASMSQLACFHPATAQSPHATRHRDTLGHDTTDTQVRQVCHFLIAPLIWRDPRHKQRGTFTVHYTVINVSAISRHPPISQEPAGKHAAESRRSQFCCGAGWG